MVISILDKTQLASLLNKHERIDFTFEFAALNDAENKRWFKKIRENYFSCGCRTGAMFMTSAFILSLTAIVYGLFFKRDMLSVVACMYLFLFICCSAAVGKIAGKITAYKKLKKDVSNLSLVLN